MNAIWGKMRINSLAPVITFLLNTTVGMYEKQDLGGSFALELRGRWLASWRVMLEADNHHQSQDRWENTQDGREEALFPPRESERGVLWLLFLFWKKKKAKHLTIKQAIEAATLWNCSPLRLHHPGCWPILCVWIVHLSSPHRKGWCCMSGTGLALNKQY